MPLLPNSRCGPPDPPENPCDFLFGIGEAMLEAAMIGLAPYLPEPGNACNETFETYVSLNQPVAELYDALSVYLVSYGITPESLGRAGRMSQDVVGVAPQFQATWEMSLFENGYPSVQKDAAGAVITVPTAASLHAFNQYLYAHGIAAYDALSVAINQKQIDWPLGPMNRPAVEKTTIGPMLPRGPQGGAVGWSWTITTVIDS